MAIAHVNDAEQRTLTNTASTVTYAPTAGNCVVAFTHQNSSAASTVTMSATGAAPTWVQSVSSYSAGTAKACAMFYALNVPSGVTAITATWSGGLSTTVDIIVIEFSGVATASAEDTSINSGNASSVSSSVSGTYTTTNAGDCIICGTGIGGTFTAPVAGGSFTLAANNAVTGIALAEWWIPGSTQTSQTASTSWSTAHSYRTVLLALKPPAANTFTYFDMVPTLTIPQRSNIEIVEY